MRRLSIVLIAACLGLPACSAGPGRAAGQPSGQSTLSASPSVAPTTAPPDTPAPAAPSVPDPPDPVRKMQTRMLRLNSFHFVEELRTPDGYVLAATSGDVQLDPLLMRGTSTFAGKPLGEVVGTRTEQWVRRTGSSCWEQTPAPDEGFAPPSALAIVFRAHLARAAKDELVISSPLPVVTGSLGPELMAAIGVTDDSYGLVLVTLALDHGVVTGWHVTLADLIRAAERVDGKADPRLSKIDATLTTTLRPFRGEARIDRPRNDEICAASAA